MCSSLSTIPSRGGKVQHFGSFDYVIAGAGSAGCLLANRLSRDPDSRVLLLEAGGSDDWVWIDVPVGYLYTIAHPRTDWCYRTQPRGRRWSASHAFLRPALQRKNLSVLTGALVSRVRTVDRQALGIEFSREGQPLYAEARRETILAAGAIGSPQLLQLSGIGKGELLNKLQIPVVHDLPGVGENLHDHLQIRMQYKVRNVKTLNGMAGSVFGKAAMALEYLAFRTGPLTMPPSQAGAFAKSDPGQATPNIEWHVQPLSLDKFGEPLHAFPAITPSVCNLRPASRGWGRVKSGDPAAHPGIRLDYI